METFFLELHRVDDMNLAFGWVMRFLKLNGIDYLPSILEFVFDTLGLASWVFAFLTLYSALIGYSKQMSHFFFLLEHSLGHKLASPYKWAFIFAGLWIGTHICAFWFAIIVVYIFTNAMMLALLSFVGGIVILICVAVLALIVPRKLKAAAQPENIRPEPAPAPATALPPQEKREKIAPPERLKIAQRKSPPPPGTDDEFEQALKLLGLKRGFTLAELKKKYRVLAKKVHADAGGSDVLYLQVKKAYEYLLTRVD